MKEKDKVKLTIIRGTMDNSSSLQEILEQLFGEKATSQIMEQVLQKEEILPKKDLKWYIEKVGERLKYSYEETRKLLNDLDKVYPIVSFQLVLREIAIDCDRKYSDHISNSSQLYSIGLNSGEIFKICGTNIKDCNFKNFAVFRTKEEARYACEILEPIMKNLFNA